MKTLVVEISGDFAHFRAHETTRENISYPFPPRTALVGMLAAILGYPRNSYWFENHPLRNIKIGLQILNPISRMFMKVNYQSTKSTINISNGSNTSILLSPDPLATELHKLSHKEYKKELEKPKYSRGQNMPTRLNLLCDVKYRLFIFTDDAELYNNLAQRLKDHKYTFPPYFGHANLLAKWKLIGEFETIPSDNNTLQNSSSIVPFSVLEMKDMSFDGLGISVQYNVPMAMKLIDEKKEIQLKNIRLSKVESIFMVENSQSFSGLFKKNTLFKINLNDEPLLFNFLPK